MPVTITRIIGFHLLVLFALVDPSSRAMASTTEQPDAKLRTLLAKAAADTDSFKDRFHAEVWLMDMSRRLKSRVKDSVKRITLLKNIHYEATRANLPPELVLAVIDTESNFNRWAISVVGAQGLMQIMPFWLKEIGRAGDNLFSIKTNLRFGCTILRHYLDKEKGDLTKALARYNGSVGKRKYPDKIFKKLRTRWYRN